MKFRARVTRRAFLELFIHLCSTLAKLAKLVVLRVCPDGLYFGSAGLRAVPEARVWCEVRREAFSQFRMEGASEEHDEIYLELTSGHLARALRSAGGASSVKLQLTNKRRPCLTVAAELALRTGHTRMVVHDLPVRVLPCRAWAECPQPPRLPSPDVSVHLPPLRTLRSIVERMANLSQHVLLEASRRGRMHLSIDTSAVSIRSSFENLGHPPRAQQDGAEDGDPEGMAQVRVDNRRLLHFFEAQQMNPTTALCNIRSDALLHLVLLNDDVSLEYFIPAA